MENNIDIKSLINSEKIISGMMTYSQIYGVLDNLKKVLDKNIDGDVVELGCNVGTTSIFIRKLLDKYNSKKKYHVYDSWEGIPELNNFEKKHAKNHSTLQRQFRKGDCKITKNSFINTFTNRNLELPIINSGWFKDIPDNKYPNKICFAFFDGDTYTSIIDSLNKVYHKVQKGGIIIIDDCGWDVLPGVELACNDFLKDKPEKLLLTGYPNNNLIYGDNCCGGIIYK
jgi:O-methyltransferase